MKTPITDERAAARPSKEETDRIIRHHVWASMGFGLIPLPLIDFIALTGVQLLMLRKLARLYNIPFRKDKVKNILSALIGGAFPPAVSGPLAASIAKGVPLIGQTTGAITMPVIAGAATYSIGKVFVQHFASGGTFLTFDPEEVRAYYADMLKEGEMGAAHPSAPLPVYSDSSNTMGAAHPSAPLSVYSDSSNTMPAESKQAESESPSEEFPVVSNTGTLPEDDLPEQNTADVPLMPLPDAAEESVSLPDESHVITKQGYAAETSSYPDSGYEMTAAQDGIAEISESDGAVAESTMTDKAKPKRKKKKNNLTAAP
jgi:uncharacterized protein (DUF697 family)